MLSGIRKKFLQLGREVEELPGGLARDNLVHSKDKLGEFIEDAFGRLAWRSWQKPIDTGCRVATPTSIRR